MIVSKLIKWSLMAAAIILGIGGALLTRPNASASKDVQHFIAADGCMWSKSDQPIKTSER